MDDLTAALAACGLSPRFVDKFIDESGFSSVEDLALAESDDLLECLGAIGVRPMKSKVTVKRMAALAEPVAPSSLRDGSITALPQPMPPVPAPTSLSVDAGPSALRPANTPVLLLLPGCEMEPSPSVDTLASQPVTVASLLPPSVVIADAEHPSPDISGPLDAVAPVPLSPRALRDLGNIIARSFFNFSCGSCADLRASARCDWLSGCSVDSFSAWLGFAVLVETAAGSSRMPVATLATDESALCSSTGRSVARGCGLGCSWEWQAAALRLGRRFGHHGCGG